MLELAYEREAKRCAQRFGSPWGRRFSRGVFDASPPALVAKIFEPRFDLDLHPPHFELHRLGRDRDRSDARVEGVELQIDFTRKPEELD